MYSLGYTHANCGGLCVKQGKGDWIRTLINFPARYKQAEEWEQEMRNHPTRKDYSIVRETVKGKKRSVTLRELRERYEMNKPMSMFDLDMDSACVYCGVGDLICKTN